jgi:long-subunit acyl-CoA synthetase (AMP-forming)
VRQGLGGKVRLILSGAAPLSNHVEAFLRVVSCAHVLQGYGMFSILFDASYTSVLIHQFPL